jgi:hypothetical protein
MLAFAIKCNHVRSLAHRVHKRALLTTRGISSGHIYTRILFDRVRLEFKKEKKKGKEKDWE